MDIAILLFDRITALDAIGPYEVLSRLPDARTRFVALQPGPKTTYQGTLTITADASLDDVTQPDVVVLPGGPGSRDAMRQKPLLEWVQLVHERTRWTTSVCTGSLILGAAGILRGLRATTHWLSLDILAAQGAEVCRDRVVVEGKVVTAAGVSAGIDMALMLAALEAGPEVAQEIQLLIEYDPQPPFDAGSPEKAPSELVERLRQGYRDRIRETPST